MAKYITTYCCNGTKHVVSFCSQMSIRYLFRDLFYIRRKVVDNSLSKRRHYTGP
jgi:hypothetical protein